MAMWEKPVREERHQQHRQQHHQHHQQHHQHQQQRNRRTPSFSSSLLDAIYHSIDESQEQDYHSKKNNPLEVEEEIACLRRATKVEKWMESHGSGGSSSRNSCRSTRSRHMNSDSSSSNDSSFFSSEAEYSASKSTPKTGDIYMSATPKQEGKLFTRTKSRAMKMYGDLKKVKHPISPGGKIASFLNSIFTPRSLKKQQQKAAMEEWSMKKSRSVKDPSPRSCLMTKNHVNHPQNHVNLPIQTPSSSSSRSKRSVRFCPVSVIVDEDCQPCGQKNTYANGHNDPILAPMPKISSHFLKKNMDSFRAYEENKKNTIKIKNKKKRFYEEDSDGGYSSCASSDLFELDNINGGCHGAHHREELPVYGTTTLKVNQAIAIANGFGYVG